MAKTSEATLVTTKRDNDVVNDINFIPKGENESFIWEKLVNENGMMPRRYQVVVKRSGVLRLLKNVKLLPGTNPCRLKGLTEMVRL